MASTSTDSIKTTVQTPFTMRYSEAIAGATAGAMTVLFLHPLDTLKTRLQASRESRSARSVALSLITSGPTAIYSGAVPALLGSAISWAIYFQSFYAVRGFIAPFFTRSTSRDLTAGTIAGVTTSVLTNPIWVLKTRRQLRDVKGKATVHRGLWHTVRDIAVNEGFRGFYRGLGPSIWLVSHGAIQFTMYELFKTLLRDDAVVYKGTSITHSVIASTMSKLIASVAAYPLQVVRTRMQERNASRTVYKSFLGASWHMVKCEGVRGFYRGLWANVARVVPQSAVTFVTYEQVLKLFLR